ncbi:MAG TPA: energy-coupled thiamine transporter ThiT [Candidatus Izemoplasmatales bacterium]|nr:energy-coupled thiamine transporter ThiT [Candidatus Izemoplasmatales bacterium]
MKTTKHETRVLTETAVLVAVALVLDTLAGLYSPFKYGGSISPAMLPIFFLAVRHGWKRGLIAGFLFGILQSLVGAATGNFYFLSIPQYLLDYLVAYTVLGVAGFFAGAVRRPWLLAAAIFAAGFLRYLAHGFSGVVYWAQWAPDGVNVWFYSFILYNLPYMSASILLCIVLGLVLQNRGILSIGLNESSKG